MRTRAGLTVLETIVAIAVCGVVLAALASVNVSSLQQTRFGNHKVQATQVLDTVGRRVIGGQDSGLLPGLNDTVVIDYGELGDLLDLGDAATNDRFRVSVENQGNYIVGSSSLGRYRVEVCFRAGEGERCVQSTTLSRRAI